MPVTSPVESGRSSSLVGATWAKPMTSSPSLRDEGTSTGKVGLGQDPAPGLAASLDRQGVEVGVGNQASVGALPATDMNGSNSLRVVECRDTNLHR